MKITKKVRPWLDKLIDNILDGTDLHVEYKLLLISLCTLQATVREVMGSLFIILGKQISTNRRPWKPGGLPVVAQILDSKICFSTRTIWQWIVTQWCVYA